jgi:hypothetical protein
MDPFPFILIGIMVVGSIAVVLYNDELPGHRGRPVLLRSAGDRGNGVR